MAGRKPLNKVRMNIKIDSELKEILDSKKIDKSAYINQILYKELVLEIHRNPSPPSLLSNPKCSVADLNCGPLDYQSSILTGLN